MKPLPRARLPDLLHITVKSRLGTENRVKSVILLIFGTVFLGLTFLHISIIIELCK